MAVKIRRQHELALARRGRALNMTRIDFIGEVKDEFGLTITNVRDKVDIKLTGETASQLSKRFLYNMRPALRFFPELTSPSNLSPGMRRRAEWVPTSPSLSLP